jgi:nitroreductase
MIIDDVETCDKVFPHTHWAGLIKDGSYGNFEDRPTAYILMLLPEGSNSKLDVGAVAQSIQLMAHSEGVGCCWMGAIDRNEIAKLCSVPDGYVIDTLISLGYPSEKSVAVEMSGDDTSYFKDSDGWLNVPKLGLNKVLFE